MESWQSGNAPDSKSGEPANTGAQVQILYSPPIDVLYLSETSLNVDLAAFLFAIKRLESVESVSLVHFLVHFGVFKA